MERSQEVEGAIQRLLDAIGSADFEAATELLSPRPEILLLGTDPEEWWSGYETVSRVMQEQLKEMQGIRIDASDVSGYADGDVGWGSARARYSMPDGTGNEVRMTAVFRREDGRWRLMQGHSSIGVPNKQAFGMSMPA
jgi:ketosteroid isomerase-like protein